MSRTTESSTALNAPKSMQRTLMTITTSGSISRSKKGCMVMSKGNIVLIILAVLCVITYCVFLHLHDIRSDIAIQNDTIESFNGEEIFN